jgi:hypothetical protein
VSGNELGFVSRRHRPFTRLFCVQLTCAVCNRLLRFAKPARPDDAKMGRDETFDPQEGPKRARRLDRESNARPKSPGCRTPQKAIMGLWGRVLIAATTPCPDCHARRPDWRSFSSPGRMVKRPRCEVGRTLSSDASKQIEDAVKQLAGHQQSELAQLTDALRGARPSQSQVVHSRPTLAARYRGRTSAAALPTTFRSTSSSWSKSRRVRRSNERRGSLSGMLFCDPL